MSAARRKGASPEGATLRSTSSKPAVGAAGRPRAPEMDSEILKAALNQMAEQGFQRMSMDGIAREAGVGKAAIYRRWASKADVAIAALELKIDAEPQDDEGSFSEATLVRVLGEIRARLLAPNYMALMGTLLAEEKQTPDLIRKFRERVWTRRRQMLRHLIQKGIRQGYLSTTADVEVIIDLLVGPMYSSYLQTGSIPADLSAKVVKAVMEGVLRSPDARARPESAQAHNDLGRIR